MAIQKENTKNTSNIITESHQTKDFNIQTKEKNENIPTRTKSASRLANKHKRRPRNNEKSVNQTVIESQKNATISNFDKLEEIRVKSYEAQQNINHLARFIQDQSVLCAQTFEVSTMSFKIPSNVWEQIKSQIIKVQSDFDTQSMEWDTILENLVTEVQKYKQRCKTMKNKIDFVKSQSCYQSTLDAEFHQSLKDIDQVYEKNRTQMFSIFDQIENVAVSELSNARKKLNYEYVGNLQIAEREMEDVYDTFTKSGKITIKDLKLSDRQNSFQQNHNKQDMEKTTPRSQQLQQQLSQRGRSQPQQRIEIINQRDSSTKPNIPRLPLDNINNNKQNAQSSSRIPPLPPTLPSERERLNSQRGPLSQRRVSARGQNQAYQQNQQLSARQLDSKRSVISVEGQNAIDMAMANPVIQSAVNVESKFEKHLEDDFPDAEQTLEFNTQRLKMFPDEYECLQAIEDEEKRILAKQYFFIIHEREIKKQIKQEKQERKLRKQLNQQNNVQGITPRNNQESNSLKESSVDSESKNVKKLHSQSSSMINAQLNQTLNNSFISLQQQLPTLGTIDRQRAQEKQYYNDVKLDELLDVPIEIDGLLKTATEKDIILRIEQEFEDKKKLHQEDRIVLPWTTGEDDESQRSESGDGQKSRISQDRNKKIYNNGAIQIIDNKNQNNAGIDSSGSFSPDSSSLIEQSLQKEQTQSIILDTPEMDDEDEVDNSYQVDNYNSNQQLKQIKRNSKLEVITEKQSEFSSSMNTNNNKVNSHRSMMKNIDCRNNDLQMYRVQSARETPCSKNVEFNRLQYMIPSQEILTNRSGNKRNEKDRDLKYKKRSQSHRQHPQLESNIPKHQAKLTRQKSNKNEEEQKIPSQQKNQAFNYFNKNDLPSNNFMSIQMNDPQPMTNLNENQILQLTQLSFQTVDKNDSMNMNIQQYQQYKSKIHQKSNSPTMIQQMNQFSSIQNHFEESRASSFMNESFEETKEKDKFLYRSSSEIMLRTSTEMYDINDLIDINQIHIPINMEQVNKIQQRESFLLDHNKDNLTKIQLKQILNNNQTSQNINQGSGMLNQNIMLNSNRLALLSQNHQMTANMIQNFLQNQTHLKMPIENGTREVTTCKRLNANNATNGNSVFTLSTFTEDTLSQMFPTQRKTIQMLQNLNSNYYTNFAGVLFTLPGGGVVNSSGVINGGDTNNCNPSGYLQQCSTVPSEPGLSSGACMTINGLNSSKQKSNLAGANNLSQKSPINIVNATNNMSMSNESLIKSIIKNRSQSNQNKKFDLSKIKISKNKIMKPMGSNTQVNQTFIQNMQYSKGLNQSFIQQQTIPTQFQQFSQQSNGQQTGHNFLVNSNQTNQQQHNSYNFNSNKSSILTQERYTAKANHRSNKL